MIRYIAHRLALALPTFLGITAVTFAITRLAPGDPALAIINQTDATNLSPNAYQQLREHLNLDQPIHQQYLHWLAGIATLDFGRSLADHEPVWDKIRHRLPWTLGVSILSIIASISIATPLGILTAARPDGKTDTIISHILYTLYSIPSYVTAMLLILLVVTIPIDSLPIRNAVSDNFDELSLAGKTLDLMKHFLLITICFTYPTLAYQARLVRGTMLDALQQDYIRTARAKGLPFLQILTRHALPNALIPLITYLGLIFPTLIAGSAILEVIFNWPGVGRLMYDSILKRDYPTVMGLSVIAALLVQLGTLLADVAYALADPRIRRQHKSINHAATQ
jgi:peptide/nickel transport system permease protein